MSSEHTKILPEILPEIPQEIPQGSSTAPAQRIRTTEI